LRIQAKLAIGLASILVGCGSGRAVPSGVKLPGAGDLAGVLEPIRDEADLPALAGAIVTEKGAVHLGVTGVRKAGNPTPAALGDPFHLGSDTKAMTAVVVGRAIDDGKLAFQTRIDEVFPDWTGRIDSGYLSVTVDQLLAHRSGLPHDLPSLANAFGSEPTDMRAARATFVEEVLRLHPVKPPGTAYEYSNLGYVTLAAMVERRTGSAWEDLVAREVFTPLGMTGAGLGAAGRADAVDAPWPHTLFFEARPWEMRLPLTPSRFADNPAVMSPAGRVHVSMEGWARFVADQLASFEGRGKLLTPETYEHLHTPLYGGDYAGGWATLMRPWAGGKAYSHAGSNTRNFAVAWIAPKRHFALLVATNQAGSRAQSACDEAVRALIRFHAAEDASDGGHDRPLP
jgi:CubicO group peptidase (beta-lactamase class C family)